MREIEIKGKREIVYMLKDDGEMNYIVIKTNGLQQIDMRRLNDIQSQGGEMMKVMRDTTLDNGQNALETYKDLITVVPKPKPKVVKAAPTQEAEGTAEEQPVVKPKRKRGRPRKSAQ